MNILKNLLNRLKQNPKAKQSIGLLIINFSGLPLGVVTSILLAKMLGAEGLGNYNFIFSIFTFSSLIVTLGLFQSGNRALVLNHSKARAKSYYGAMLVIVLLLFTLLSSVLLLYGLMDPNLKNKNLTSTFLAVLPLGLIILSGNYIETLLQADNRIGLISFYRLSSKVLYLLCLISLYLIEGFHENRLLLIAIYSYCIAYSLSFLLVISKLRPSAKRLANRFKEIWLYNKSFGFNIYIGSVFAVGFASLSQILIGYFSPNNGSVGFYALALTFCAPLSLIPNTIATVYYKDFARSPKVPDKMLKFSLLISFMALLLLWLVIKPFVNFFYGEDFKSVITLSYILSIGVLAHGFGDMYNRFLGANGQSIALRNSAFIVGIASTITGFVLIPLFGVYGAVAASLTAGFIYLSAIYSCYLKFISNGSLNNQVQRS